MIRRTGKSLAAALSIMMGSAASASTPVTITAADGFALHAEYYPADRPGPGVLLLHQCDREGAETGYERLADLLARRGVHVLMLDFRGYGKSRDEHFTGENWQEARPHFADDVTMALAHLTALDDVDGSRIGVVGASCGGREAVDLAARDDSIRAIVLLSAWLGRDPAAAIEPVADLPVFCVAAQDDPFARAVETAQVAFRASTHADSRIVTYKGVEHGTPLFAVDDQLEITLANWLETRLRGKTESGKTESRNGER